MKFSVDQIAHLVNGRVLGEGQRAIEGVAGLEEANERDLSFVRDAKNPSALQSFHGTRAGAIIVPKGFEAKNKTVIEVDNPVAAFARVLGEVSKETQPRVSGIHPMASVAKSAKIAPTAAIGPFCVVDEGAEISDGVRLLAQIYVGPRARIGKDSLIYPQVVIREDVKIGQRCIVHGGAVLGSDGFGFYFDQGRHNKIPQVGDVVIEDDVEIGSCTTIDRATTGSTIVRRGAKIDNLVQIAHNVEVGAASILVAQVGIAGSSRLGQGVVLAGQVGVADHVKIGDGAQVGAQSGIKDDIPPKGVFFGSPAQPIVDAMKQMALFRRLPELFKDVKRLKENNSPHG